MIQTAYNFTERAECYATLDLGALHHALRDAQATAKVWSDSYQAAPVGSADREHAGNRHGYYLDDCSTIRTAIAKYRHPRTAPKAPTAAGWEVLA